MITKKFILTITFGSFLLAWGCTGNSAPTAEQQEMYENFVNPPNRNRPQPFWHINRELTTNYGCLSERWIWGCCCIAVDSGSDVERKGDLSGYNSRIFE